jgi:beta-lactamase regulating signal transducer with metallopeptidase domain
VSFQTRLLIVSLGAFAGSGLVGAALVPWLWRRIPAATPAERAAALLRLRLLPAALALSGAAFTVTSYLLFEPRGNHEDIGIILLALAALAMILGSAAVVRTLQLSRATRNVCQGWLRTAEPVSLPGARVPALAVASSFPIVAVVGMFRPRLIVARSVLTACTPEEMATIVAHEQAHLAARDNLRRAMFLLAPDVLGWLPLSGRLLADWREATEEAADDAAAASSGERRLLLAQALIKVARLAPPGSRPTALPASALYDGESIERRVRRLLAPPRVDRPARTAWQRAAVAGFVLGACGLAIGGVQAILELAVNFLP